MWFKKSVSIHHRLRLRRDDSSWVSMTVKLQTLRERLAIALHTPRISARCHLRVLSELCLKSMSCRDDTVACVEYSFGSLAEERPSPIRPQSYKCESLRPGRRDS
jgi:hypothetical protein